MNIYNILTKARKKRWINSLTKNGSVIDKNITLREPKYIKVKGNVFLGPGTKLLCWGGYSSGKTYQPLNPEFVLENNVHTSRNFTVQCAGRIVIGENTLIASEVFVIDFNHGMSPYTDSYLDNDLEVSEVIIGKGCWIGNSVIILPGVHIGEKTIIGAGSVVTHDIPSYSIAVGNPARVVKYWDSNINKWCGCDKKVKEFIN